MPQLIKHIDAIARQKQRDVLYIQFTNADVHKDDEFVLFPELVDWEHLKDRNDVIDILNANQIPWYPCGEFADPNLMMSYQGQIYVDIPYDTSNPQYLALEKFLENPDGSMRSPRVTFYLVSLTSALENAHQDEPGYWDQFE